MSHLKKKTKKIVLRLLPMKYDVWKNGLDVEKNNSAMHGESYPKKYRIEQPFKNNENTNTRRQEPTGTL